jgi:ClpP class serine protease
VSSDAKALAILINSPGGSPAFSHNIYKRLRMFHEDTGKPVLTFAEDLAASGGYFILSAGRQILIRGDKAYASKSSLVGSVGAISMRADINQFLEQHGVKSSIISSQG